MCGFFGALVLTEADEGGGLETVHGCGDGPGSLGTVVSLVLLVVVVIVTTAGASCHWAEAGTEAKAAGELCGHLHDGDGDQTSCADEDDCLVHGGGGGGGCWLVSEEGEWASDDIAMDLSAFILSQLPAADDRDVILRRCCK